MIAKIGTFDFSSYVRVTAGDGLNPYGDPFVEPQFSESAFGVGQSLINLKVSNRQQVWPLYLNDSNVDQVHELVQDLARTLSTPGLQVEWRTDGASTSTFYTVEAARFEPNFDLRQTNHGWLAGVLRVWCNPPYGHTGTYRVVGTAQAPGMVQQVPIGSLAGDAPAAARVQISAPAVATLGDRGRIIGFAGLPDPSYPARWPAASMSVSANATIVSAGASDMQDGKYVRCPDGFRSRFGVTLAPASQFHGKRHRVLAMARTRQYNGLAISARLEGEPIGATGLATSPYGLSVVDLGAFETPANDPRSSLRLELEAANPNDTSFPPARYHRIGLTSETGVYQGVNQLVIVPEDDLTILADIGDYAIAEDAFENTLAVGAAGTVALDGRYDAFGNLWALPTLTMAASRSLYENNNGQFKGFGAVGSPYRQGALLNHRPTRDLRAVAFTDAGLVDVATHTLAAIRKCFDGVNVPAASGAYVEGQLWMGYTPWIALLSHRNGATTLHASQAISLTNPTVANQLARLEFTSRGPAFGLSVIEVWASSPAFASVGASVGALEEPGQVALIGNYAQRFRHFQMAESPERLLAAGDTYCLGDLAYLEAAGAGSVVRRFTAQLGADPHLNPLRGAGAIAFCAPVDANTALATTSVEVRAQERFGLAR